MQWYNMLMIIKQWLGHDPCECVFISPPFIPRPPSLSLSLSAHLLIVCNQHTCLPSTHHLLTLRGLPAWLVAPRRHTLLISYFVCVAWSFTSVLVVSRNTTRQPASPVYRAHPASSQPGTLPAKRFPLDFVSPSPVPNLSRPPSLLAWRL